MRHLLIATVCVILLPTFSFAQQKALPSPPRADVQPAIQNLAPDVSSECDSDSSNLLTNCGFETGDFTDWGVIGTTDFVGVAGNAHSGNFGAFFGTIGENTQLFQTFVTQPGSYYSASFWLQNPVGGPGTYFLALFCHGETGEFCDTIVELQDPDPFDWTLYSIGSEQAIDSAATIWFYIRHDPDFFYVDDVHVD